MELERFNNKGIWKKFKEAVSQSFDFGCDGLIKHITATVHYHNVKGTPYGDELIESNGETGGDVYDAIEVFDIDADWSMEDYVEYDLLVKIERAEIEYERIATYQKELETFRKERENERKRKREEELVEKNKKIAPVTTSEVVDKRTEERPEEKKINNLILQYQQ